VAALLVAVVTMVALFGVSLLAGSVPKVDKPAPSSASPAPLPVDQAIEAGSYVVRSMDVPAFTIMVPDGWRSLGGFAIHKGELDGSDHVGVAFWTVNNLYADPCTRTLMDPPIGPTVSDLADAMSNASWAQDVRSTSVRLGGREARHIEFTLPRALGCPGGSYVLWLHDSGAVRYAQGGGQHFMVWLLDVDGRRVLIEADSMPGAIEADVAALQEMVRSIRFEPAEH
jgi:hypothetical protein